MNRFDLVIFDCDGVLFDSREANRAYYDRIRAEFGLPPMDEAEMDYVHMHTAQESVAFLFRDRPELLPAAEAFVATLDYSAFLHLMTPEPGFPELVEAVRPPVLTAVSTNRSTTMPELRRVFGLDRWFDRIVCALDVEHPKPHPEGVFRILEDLGVAPGRALYVGDSKVDEEVAGRAGLAFAAYRNPGLRAAFHVGRHGELLPVIRGEGRPEGLQGPVIRSTPPR
ncbi:HAD hydrolase-like protein [Dissulfurirhabdus thermomarina]|uniref:HAD hydrolase-like protein n=1 Tax=Dissulfurirhabdus thermomarina TaxID=1765737 RepID=A0A6N9TUH8_DISTH|nr:HAD hydrolase-like protein [Dissulfurirhabdus thermomarina]NDY42156.1 HAD hydrolase-like protein [Dissulfurirhabdus thermomarina]NMX22414.1 HAD hydrolase-like protein [Dissulfurirhabdus thermomarina]